VAGTQTRQHVFADLSSDKALMALGLEPTADFVPPRLPLALDNMGLAGGAGNSQSGGNGSGDESLQDFALGWLKDHPCVSTPLVGAVRPEYVDHAKKVFFSAS